MSKYSPNAFLQQKYGWSSTRGGTFIVTFYIVLAMRNESSWTVVIHKNILIFVYCFMRDPTIYLISPDHMV